MPGPGKTFDAFQSDNSSCKAFATDQVRGQADASNQRTAGAVALTTILGAGLGAAVGGSVGDAGSGAAIGAATGAGTGTMIGAGNGANDQAMIQQQYDNAFSQCMFAKGEQVPGFAPAVMAGPGPAADPLVRSSQAELIRLGYLHGTADGYIGPRTRSAISGFEQSPACRLTAPHRPVCSPGCSRPRPARRRPPHLPRRPATGSRRRDQGARQGAGVQQLGRTHRIADCDPGIRDRAGGSSNWVAPTKQ